MGDQRLLGARAPFLVTAVLALTACSSADETQDEDTDDEVVLYDPDEATFVDGVDHPFFPLPVGATWTYEGQLAEGLERIEIEVLATPREVNGVSAVVVRDVAYLDDVEVERTDDWYAQDSDGNVWYLGEDTCEVEDGDCVSFEGAWEWGVDGAVAGVIMKADPSVDGERYYQEFYEGEAEDVGEVIGVDEDISVPAGDFTGCIRTRDTSALEPDIEEEKVYCPGVGNVFVLESDGDVELIETTGL